MDLGGTRRDQVRDIYELAQFDANSRSGEFKLWLISYGSSV